MVEPLAEKVIWAQDVESEWNHQANASWVDGLAYNPAEVGWQFMNVLKV